MMVGDWPDIDTLTASIASTTTTISVADGTLYYKNFHLDIDNETLTVAANGSGTTFTARRGAWGSTATVHVSGSEVRIRPRFTSKQILDALNQALDETFPLLYKPVLDTSLSTLSNTFEYTVPNLDGTPIPYISKIELKLSGFVDFVEVRGWQIRRGSTPKIQFRDVQEAAATIRIHGYGGFPHLTSILDMDALYPARAEGLLPVGAAAALLMAAENRRVGSDTLANDQREQANRVGAAMSASSALYARFRAMTLAAAMPPLPKHAVPTF